MEQSAHTVSSEILTPVGRNLHFGTAKENHGFRYIRMYRKARMEMKVGLTFACMNLKKLAKIKEKCGLIKDKGLQISFIPDKILFIKEKWLWDVYSRAALSTI